MVIMKTSRNAKLGKGKTKRNTEDTVFKKWTVKKKINKSTPVQSLGQGPIVAPGLMRPVMFDQHHSLVFFIKSLI